MCRDVGCDFPSTRGFPSANVQGVVGDGCRAWTSMFVSVGLGFPTSAI